MTNPSVPSATVLVLSIPGVDPARAARAARDGAGDLAVEVKFVDPAGSLAAALNAAAGASQAPFLALVHADAAPRPGWLAALLEALRADPGAVAATAELRGPDGEVESRGYGFAWAAPYPLTPVPRLDRPTGPGAVEVTAATCAALLVRADAFRRVGGFDEHLGSPLAELDLTLRLRELGPVLFAPAALADHLASCSADCTDADTSAFLRRWLEPFTRSRLDPAPTFRPAGRTASRPPASLVLVLRDDLESAAPVLSAALQLMSAGDELLLADGGSTDGTAGFLALAARRAGGELRSVRGADPAAAVRAALDAAALPVVAFLAPAAELTPPWLDALIAAAAGDLVGLRAGGGGGLAGPAEALRELSRAAPEALLPGDLDGAAAALERLGRPVRMVPGPLTAEEAARRRAAAVARFRAGEHAPATAELAETWARQPDPEAVAASLIEALTGTVVDDPALPGYLNTSNRAEGWQSRAYVEAALALLRAVPGHCLARTLADLRQAAIGRDRRLGLLLARWYEGAGDLDLACQLARRARDAYAYDLNAQALLRRIEAARAGGGDADRFAGLEARLARRFCDRPWTHAEVQENGNVHVCCSGWLPGPIGNLYQQPFDEIWNSEAAQELRRSILDGSFRHCNFATCHFIGALGPDGTGALAPALTPERAAEFPLRTERGPREVILNHDPACNLACPQCRRDFWHGDDAQRARLDGLVSRLLPGALRDAQEFMPDTAGEVFFSRHSRKLLKSVTRERYPDLRLWLISNGQLFDRRAYEDFDLRGRISRVSISIDAARDETYRILRRGGELARVLRNLDFLAGLRRTEGEAFELVLSFVVSALNFREMPEFVRIAHRFDATASFSILLNHGTFPPEQFAALNVANPEHPLHAEFLDVLAAPELALPGVGLGGFAQLGRSRSRPPPPVAHPGPQPLPATGA